MSRGHDRERDVIRVLEGRGYVCIRSAGSLGPVDVVGMKAPFNIDRHGVPSDAGRGDIVFVEVKSTAGGPYERFGPKDRAEMLDLAERAGANAWLAWWPPCKPGQRKADTLTWIPSDQWPPVGARK